MAITTPGSNSSIHSGGNPTPRKRLAYRGASRGWSPSDQFAWDYRDKTGGGGGGCEGASEDEVVLSADGRERAGSAIVGLVGGARISGMILGQWSTWVLERDMRPTASI